MILLNINGADYSENVIIGSYAVNSNDVYTEWTNANGINNRDIIRKKVTGSFDMEFKTMEEYQKFTEFIERSKKPGGYIPCDLYVNNLGHNKSCNLFISYAPSLTRVWGYKDHISEFTVDIEER